MVININIEAVFIFWSKVATHYFTLPWAVHSDFELLRGQIATWYWCILVGDLSLARLIKKGGEAEIS